MAPAGTGSSARSLTISAASFTRSGRGRLSSWRCAPTFDFGGLFTGPHNALSLFPNLPASGPLSIFSATVRCRSGLALLRRRTYACFRPFPSGLKSQMFQRESAYWVARLPIVGSVSGRSFAAPFRRSGRARAFRPMPTCLHHTLLGGWNRSALGKPQPRVTAASSSRGAPARSASPPNSARTSSETPKKNGALGYFARHAHIQRRRGSRS
jgi:hypothetical protein